MVTVLFFSGAIVILGLWRQSDAHLRRALEEMARTETQRQRTDEAVLTLGLAMEDAQFANSAIHHDDPLLRGHLSDFFREVVQAPAPQQSPMLAAAAKLFLAREASSAGDIEAADRQFAENIQQWRTLLNEHPDSPIIERCAVSCATAFEQHFRSHHPGRLARHEYVAGYSILQHFDLQVPADQIWMRGYARQLEHESETLLALDPLYRREVKDRTESAKWIREALCLSVTPGEVALSDDVTGWARACWLQARDQLRIKDLRGAKANLQDALAILERLEDADRANDTLRRLEFGIHASFVSLQRFRQRQVPAAAHCREVVRLGEVIRESSSSDSDRLEIEMAMAEAHRSLGDAAWEEGDRGTATQQWLQGAVYFDRHRDRVRWKQLAHYRHWGDMSLKAAQTLAADGCPADALTAYSSAAGAFDLLMRRRDAADATLLGAIRAWEGVAAMESQLGNGDSARVASLKALEAHRVRARQNPEDLRLQERVRDLESRIVSARD